MKKRETKGLDTLAPNPHNPRVITEWQKQALRKSLDKFGDLSGIVFNTRTSQLVGGHQRIEAFVDKNAKGDYKGKVVIEERLAKPDKCGTVAWGYVEIDGARHGYREVDWDENTEKAANIAANRHGGEFQEEELAEIIKELDGNIDTELLGFDSSELDALLEEDHFDGSKSEGVPELPEEANAAFLIYLSFKKRDEFLDALRLITAGYRTSIQEGGRYAHVAAENPSGESGMNVIEFLRSRLA